MIELLLTPFIALYVFVSGLFGLQEQPTLGAFGDPFLIEQGGTSTSTTPGKDQILIGDGTGLYEYVNIDQHASSTGGGTAFTSFAWNEFVGGGANDNYLAPTTSPLGIVVTASSTFTNDINILGNATITNATTTKLNITTSLRLNSDEITDFDGDGTISIVNGSIRVIDVNCTNCLSGTEIDESSLTITTSTISDFESSLLTTTTLALEKCADGEILESSSGSWICATDDGGSFNSISWDLFGISPSELRPTTTVGINVVASSTISDLTSINVTTTNFIINSEKFSSLTGAGVSLSGTSLIFDCSEVEGVGIDCSGENITLDATGDWTGTLDGQEGTYYLNQENHTNRSWYMDKNGELTPTTTRTVSISTLNVTSTATFTGLATFNGGVTLEAGDAFTFNSDVFTDLTGVGLIIKNGALRVNPESDWSYQSNGVTALAPTTSIGLWSRGIFYASSTAIFDGELDVRTTNTSTFDGGIHITNATHGLEVDSLISCDTIDTDSQGRFKCGTDDTGGAGSFNSIVWDLVAGTNYVQVTTTKDVLIRSGTKLGVNTTTVSSNHLFGVEGNVIIAGATRLDTLRVTSTSQFDGLATFNGGVTLEAGDTLTFNGDAFTDLTGSGLSLANGKLNVTNESNWSINKQSNLVPTTTKAVSFSSFSATSTSVTSTIAFGLHLTDSTHGLEIDSLLNCNTIDTDGEGRLKCGTDETGGGGSFNSISWDLYGVSPSELRPTTTVGINVTASSTITNLTMTKATTTNVHLIGSTISAGSIDFIGGDLYIQDDLELDGGLFGAAMPAATCNNGTTDKLLWNSTTGVFTCGTDQNTGGAGGGDPTNWISTTTDIFGNTLKVSSTPAFTITPTTTVNMYIGGDLEVEGNSTTTGQFVVGNDGDGQGDSFINFFLNKVSKWVLGVDDSDLDQFKLSAGGALGTQDVLIASSTIGSAGSIDIKGAVSREGFFSAVFAVGGGADIDTSFVNIPFDTVWVNDTGFYSFTAGPSKSSVTTTVKGLYKITADCEVAQTVGTGSNGTNCQLTKNSSIINGAECEGDGPTNATTLDNGSCSITTIQSLNKNDYIQLQAAVTVSGPTNSAGVDGNRLTIEFLRFE